MDSGEELEYIPILPDRSNENDVKNLLDPKWRSFESTWSLSDVHDFSSRSRNQLVFEHILDFEQSEKTDIANYFNIRVDDSCFPIFVRHYDELEGFIMLIHGVLRKSTSSLNATDFKSAIYRATGLPVKYQDPKIFGLQIDSITFWNKLPAIQEPEPTTFVELRFNFSFSFFEKQPGLIGFVRVFIINSQNQSSRLVVPSGCHISDELNLCLEPSMTTQGLKELVALAYYTGPKDIHLRFGGNYLEDAEATLDHLGMADGSVVRVSTTRDIDSGFMQTDQNGHKSIDDGTSPSLHTETRSHGSTQTFWTARSSIWQEFWSARSRATKDKPRHLKAPTKFLTTIKERGLVPSSDEEIDWSGKGMHVQFETNEDVNLEIGKVVGWSATALVQKVTCRRISLAKKTIHCRRMRLEDALCEVEHLHRLNHPHIVQLIGTYLQGPEFSILLYPLAEWNLGDFFHTEDLELDYKRDFLQCSMLCLLEAINYIHKETIRHMDIKPSNILVKRDSIEKWPWAHGLRILLADFDIAHSFRNKDTSKTEDGGRGSPLYCSPEAYAGEPRGQASDIFSLGCVFAEIMAICFWNSLEAFEGCRTNSASKAYHFNLLEVYQWLLQRKENGKCYISSIEAIYGGGYPGPRIVDRVLEMLARSPTKRPRASELLDSGIFNLQRGHSCKCERLPLVRED